MNDLERVERLLQEAIMLLRDSGFPLAAETLHENLRAIRVAPTAGARRHRIFQLRDLFDGTGTAADVFFCTPDEGACGLRYARTEANRRNEQRYRRTLESIQEILSVAGAA